MSLLHRNLQQVRHISPVCHSKASEKPSRSPAKKTKWLNATTEPAPLSEQNMTEDVDVTEPHAETEPIVFVIRNRSSPPYCVELKVSDRPLTLEVDTGAAVSLVPELAVSSLLSSMELQPTDVVLKTCTGESILVLGSSPVTVSYGRQKCTNLNLLIVRGTSPCVMGMYWLAVIRLDWRAVGKIDTTFRFPSPHRGGHYFAGPLF